MARHPFIAVLLALLVAWTSAHSGPAMAFSPSGSTVVLCTGAGAVTLVLDEPGSPVHPHRPCPLCLAAQDAGMPPAPLAIARPGIARPMVFAPPGGPPAAASPGLAPRARAPPLPV